MMGCDTPAKRAHELYVDGERIVTHSCPRKMMAPASAFIKAFNWAEKGRLGHLYPVGEMPAFVGEAIDLIGSEMHKIQTNEMEEAQRKARSGK